MCCSLTIICQLDSCCKCQRTMNNVVLEICMIRFLWNSSSQVEFWQNGIPITLLDFQCPYQPPRISKCGYSIKDNISHKYIIHTVPLEFRSQKPFQPYTAPFGNQDLRHFGYSMEYRGQILRSCMYVYSLITRLILQLYLQYSPRWNHDIHLAICIPELCF